MIQRSIFFPREGVRHTGSGHKLLTFLLVVVASVVASDASHNAWNSARLPPLYVPFTCSVVPPLPRSLCCSALCVCCIRLLAVLLPFVPFPLLELTCAACTAVFCHLMASRIISRRSNTCEPAAEALVDSAHCS